MGRSIMCEAFLRVPGHQGCRAHTSRLSRLLSISAAGPCSRAYSIVLFLRPRMAALSKVRQEKSFRGRAQDVACRSWERPEEVRWKRHVLSGLRKVSVYEMPQPLALAANQSTTAGSSVLRKMLCCSCAAASACLCETSHAVHKCRGTHFQMASSHAAPVSAHTSAAAATCRISTNPNPSEKWDRTLKTYSCMRVQCR